MVQMLSGVTVVRRWCWMVGNGLSDSLESCRRSLFDILISLQGVVSLKVSTPYNEVSQYVVEGLVHSLSAAAVHSMQMLEVRR